MVDIDAFLLGVANEVASMLQSLEPTGRGVRHWLVVEDGTGLASADVGESEFTPSDLLAVLIERGVNSAAYVTYLPDDSERVLAQVLVADPPDSDIRQATVHRTADGLIRIGRWEYIV